MRINKLPKTKNKKNFNSQSGFSLIELIVIVLVISVIAAIGVARFQSAVMASNEAAAVSALKLVFNAQTSYGSGSQSYATFDQLISVGSIDEAFEDTDTNPNTAERNGYLYQFTVNGNTLVISAIPASTGIVGTGRSRIGIDGGGLLYKDVNNLTTHYTTEADLRSGTSVLYNSDQ